MFNITLKYLQEQFQNYYQHLPDIIVRAPGRVNLIGEHTDYNQGFVLPLAINYYVWIAASYKPAASVQIYSLDFNELKSFPLDQSLELPDEEKRSALSWSGYIAGSVWAMKQHGYNIPGSFMMIKGNVPIGAGLSSSAAVEVATTRTFCRLTNTSWDAKKMAQISQQAENQWMKVNCGIMDQMISACGREAHTLLIDCQNLSTHHFPLPKNIAIIVMDTMTRRELKESNYNNRRQECEQAARILGIASLRDISLSDFYKHSNKLSGNLLLRARHVISENQRVLDAVEAMEKNDCSQLGNLLNASHDSLRDDFQVCNKALDVIVQIARKQNGCYGSRMTGAGFGGCAIGLVDKTKIESFIHNVTYKYQEIIGIVPNIYTCYATNGAEVLT